MNQTTQQIKSSLLEKQKETTAQIDSLKREVSLDEREIKGINLFENNHVEIHDDEASTVMSESGKTSYLVNKKNGTCQCKDHEFMAKYGIVCKHRVADKLAREELEDDDVIITFASVAESVSVVPSLPVKVKTEKAKNDPYGLLV